MVVNKLGVKRGGKDPGNFSRHCGKTLVVVVVVDVQELGTTQPPIKGCSIMKLLGGPIFGMNRMRNTNI